MLVKREPNSGSVGLKHNGVPTTRHGGLGSRDASFSFSATRCRAAQRKYMHDVPLCVGKPNGLNLNEAEIEYRNKMKKFAILKNDVSKGDKLSSVEVYFKRVNFDGISRRSFIEYKDSRFNKDLEAGSPIKKEYLDA